MLITILKKKDLICAEISFLKFIRILNALVDIDMNKIKIKRKQM